MESPHDESKESVDHEKDMAATAIVPNKLLSPEGESLNTGDEIVVRIVKNYGDESEIEYAPKKEQDTSSDESAPADDVGSEFASMDKEY